ncbi:MAG: hypothetical protein MUP09_08160 [Thiovulaceae bacterium]|nr:hypothetical protein [Sulfurimonadaceae bacterium]
MNRFSDHELWEYIRENLLYAMITAAGGINRSNVLKCAQTGVDAIVPSRPHQAGMSDLTSSWNSL